VKEYSTEVRGSPWLKQKLKGLISCASSHVLMCPSVVSELVAKGEHAINTFLFSSYVVN